VLGQHERLAAAVVLPPFACQQTALFECGKQLGDGGWGDGGAADRA
jgi:hypothetical protein